MKKYISLFLAVTFYTFTLPQPVHAQWVVACVNCSTWMTQIPQYAEDLINTASNITSSVMARADDLNKYVLDPLANNMLAAVQIQKQLSTINFITAAFGNEGSLLIQNPEQWVKNKGKNQVQIALGSIQQQNGLYKDSLLASVIGNYKSADDLTKTIQDLGSSNVPNAVQKNICNDSSLTNLAKNDVMLSDGSYDPTLLQRRKVELYNTLCVGNAVTNAELARTLNAINEQIPSIGGWDAWLLTTGGDNPYARSVRVNLAIAKKVDQAEQAKKDELNRNGGIANKTNCLETALPINDDEGNPMPGTALPCSLEEVTQTGNALNSQYQEALNAPLKKLQATFGTGIYKSLGSIMSIVGSMRELSTAFNGSNGGSSSGPGSSVAITFPQDLVDPTHRAQTIDNVRDPLNKHLQELSKLEATENRFLAALSEYEGQLGGLKQCYDDVVRDHPNASSDPRVTGAYSFISSRQSTAASFRSISTSNLNKSGETRSLINSTLLFISSSRSTQEIITKFTEYQKEVQARGLPDFSVAPQREGSLIRFQADIRSESMEGGPMPTHTANCSRVRQQYESFFGSGGA